MTNGWLAGYQGAWRASGPRIPSDTPAWTDVEVAYAHSCVRAGIDLDDLGVWARAVGTVRLRTSGAQREWHRGLTSAEGIRLTNNTEQGVAYAIWARGFLGLFAPSVDPGPSCVRLRPIERARAGRRDRGIWDGETEAIVRWWRVASDDQSNHRVEDFNEIVLPL